MSTVATRALNAELRANQLADVPSSDDDSVVLQNLNSIIKQDGRGVMYVNESEAYHDFIDDVVRVLGEDVILSNITVVGFNHRAARLVINY